MGLPLPLAHRHTKCTPHAGRGPAKTPDPCSEARAAHITKVAVANQAGPELVSSALIWGTSWGSPGRAQVAQPPPPRGLQILTLPRHHPLGVPLGQHPRVPVEAGLLHLREERSNCDNASPVHWERNSKLGEHCVNTTDVNTTRGRGTGSNHPAERGGNSTDYQMVHVLPSMCPPWGQPGTLTSSGP